MVTLGSAVLMTLALVGCGGEGDSDLPEFSGAPGGQSEGESEADTTAVRAVASGVAADRILASARELAEKKQHTEGGSTVNIQSVEITGSTAKITDCFKDDSINLTAAGKPAERPNLGIDQLAAELVKEGTTWRVTNLVQTTLKKCKA
jgi:ABC-type phosphate transport system substrate-binding protein